MSQRPKVTTTGQEIELQSVGGAAKPADAVQGLPVDDSILRPADIALGAQDLAEQLKRKFNETLQSIELVGNDRRSLVEEPKGGRLARGMEARNVRVVTQRNQHYTRTEMVIAADGAMQRHEPMSEKNKRLFMSITSYIGPIDRAFYGSPEAKIFVVNVPAGQYGRATINDVPMLLAPGAHVIEGSLVLGQHDVAEVLAREIESRPDDPTNRRQANVNGAFVSSGELNVSHGTAHALMIPPGEFVLVTVDNKRSLLKGREAPYFIRSKTQFEVKDNRSYKPAETRHVSHGTLRFFNIPVGQIAAIRINGEAHLVKGNGKPFVLGNSGEQVEFDSNTGFHSNTEKLIRFGDKVYFNIPANEVLACQKDGEVMFLEAGNNELSQQEKQVSLESGATLFTVGERVGNLLYQREEGEGFGFHPTTTQQISVGQHDRVYVEPNSVLVTQQLGSSPRAVEMPQKAVKICEPSEQVLGVVDMRLKQLRMPTPSKVQAHVADGRSKPNSFSYMMDGGTKVALKIVASFKVKDAVKFLAVAGDADQITTFIENTIVSDLTSFMVSRPYSGVFHASGTAIDLPVASSAEASYDELGDQGALNAQAQHYIADKLAEFGIELQSLQFEDFAPYNTKVREDLEKAAEQTLLQRSKLDQLRAEQAANQQEQEMRQQLKLTALKNQQALLEAEQELIEKQQALAAAKRELAETQAQTTGFDQLGPLVAAVNLVKQNPDQAEFILKFMQMQSYAQAAKGMNVTTVTPSFGAQLGMFNSGASTMNPAMLAQLAQAGVGAHNAVDQQRPESP